MLNVVTESQREEKLVLYIWCFVVLYFASASDLYGFGDCKELCLFIKSSNIDLKV